MTPDASSPVPVARVTGEIDLANAGQVREEVLALAEDVDGLVVDFTDVSYLDSSGVSVLFQLARDLGRRDQSLAVTIPACSPLRRVLKINGFEEIVPICDDLEAAFNLMAQQP